MKKHLPINTQTLKLHYRKRPGITLGPFLLHSITPEQYNENNERYAEELNMLRRQESQLDSADQNFYVTVGYLLELFKNAKTLYARANTDEKREILKLLIRT